MLHLLDDVAFKTRRATPLEILAGWGTSSADNMTDLWCIGTAEMN